MFIQVYGYDRKQGAKSLGASLVSTRVRISRKLRDMQKARKNGVR